MAQDVPDKFKIQRPEDTLPRKLYADEIIKTLYSIAEGRKYGGGTITPERFVSLLAKEGRTNIGANGIDEKDPESQTLFDTLYYAGIPEPRIPVILREKQQIAKRLGISEDKAWHGTGVAKIDGKIVSSGKDYEAKMKGSYSNIHGLEANKEVYDTAKRILSGQLTPSEKAVIFREQEQTRVLEKVGLPNVNSKTLRNLNSEARDKIDKAYYPLATERASANMLADSLANRLLEEEGISTPSIRASDRRLMWDHEIASVIGTMRANMDPEVVERNKKFNEPRKVSIGDAASMLLEKLGSLFSK